MNEKLNRLLAQLSSVIFGKERECRLTVCALLAGGDLLIEDVPGVGVPGRVMTDMMTDVTAGHAVRKKTCLHKRKLIIFFSRYS